MADCHLITGASGFIGSHLSRALVGEKDEQGQAKHMVIGIDDLSGSDGSNLQDVYKRSNFFFYHKDCANYEKMEEIIEAWRPDVVWHLAANAREGASIFDPFYIVRTNIFISSVVFELAIKYKVKKVVFFSSMAVAGDNIPPFTEDQPRKPVDPYGICKAATEDLLEKLGSVHDIKWTIIRPHNVGGVGQAFDAYRNVLTIFANRIMRGDPIYLFGRQNRRAFSPIADSLPAFLRAGDLDTANGEIIYVGGKEAITIDQLADEVILNMPEYSAPERIYLPPRPLEVENAFCATEKSERLLGYEERQGWRACVREVCEWAKEKGRQEWQYLRELPLRNEKTPLPWQELLDRKAL